MSNKSWFYLTLWRGTPPEFTDEFDVEVENRNQFFTSIRTSDSATSDIDTTALATANVVKQNTFNTDITIATEVVWLVG